MIRKALRAALLAMILSSSVAVLGYVSLIAIDLSANLRADTIADAETLAAVVAEERAALGLPQGLAVDAELAETDVGASFRRGDEYGLRVGGVLATRHTVRHELLHIREGHVDAAHALSAEGHHRLRYWLVEEPHALLVGIGMLR